MLCSKVPAQVKVTVSQLSLIQPDLGEATYAVYQLIPYESYDNVTKAHDIALIQVR